MSNIAESYVTRSSNDKKRCKNKRYTARLLADGCTSCCYCGKEGSLTVEHILPLAAGGQNKMINMRLCCEACNTKASWVDGILSDNWHVNMCALTDKEEKTLIDSIYNIKLKAIQNWVTREVPPNPPDCIDIA